MQNEAESPPASRPKEGATSSSGVDYLVKVVIIGDSGVGKLPYVVQLFACFFFVVQKLKHSLIKYIGKSNIMSRFTNGQFYEDSKTTIGVAFATKSFSINPDSPDLTPQEGTDVKLQVWDTAGQERYRALCSAYYRGALGALVVYDITNRQSLEHIPKWLEELDRYCTQDVVVILVGNKCDLVSQRCVSVEEGKRLAEKENMFFIETSAKSGSNIEKAFVQLTKEIIQVARQQPIVEEKGEVPKSKGVVELAPEEPEDDEGSGAKPPPRGKDCNC
ncbi:Ras-related protein Rab-11A, variant 2 [Balamuthia mandrillaris]